MDTIANFDIGGNCHHFFDGAFGDKFAVAFFAFEDNSHAAAGKIERDFVDKFVSVEGGFEAVAFGAFDDGGVNEILETSLEVAVVVGIAENVRIVVATEVYIFFEDDSIFGERASFVGAKDIHFTESLNGTEGLDDDFFL